MKNFFRPFRMGWSRDPWYAKLPAEEEVEGSSVRPDAGATRFQRSFRFVEQLPIAQRMSVMVVVMLLIFYVFSSIRSAVLGPAVQQSVHSIADKATIARRLSTSPAMPATLPATRPRGLGAAQITGSCPHGVQKALLPSKDVLVVVCNGGTVLTMKLK